MRDRRFERGAAGAFQVLVLSRGLIAKGRLIPKDDPVVEEAGPLKEEVQVGHLDSDGALFAPGGTPRPTMPCLM